MNFGYARRTGGHTILRFDDTNPEAEEEEFFEMIKKEVTWLGHSPKCVTHSSSYFGQLHALAVQLIKSGDAYVCHQTQEEVRASRALLVEAHHQKGEVPAAAKSPWRDRSVEENLRWFERMRQGRVGEGEAFLRFKGDLAASNPNMWDLAAYRVKFTPHPGEGGREWCIYPTYDFTHCVIDSIENVTHSLCTLEFETRQAPEGSYYWLLDRLGMYKPATWEYGRLNLTHNVLSKRRLNLLVTQRLVNGWDDPRLLTLAGLRRRGYSSESINRFCETVGVTRVDGVLTRFEVLESTLRAELDASARRVMAVLRPLRVTIENLPAPVDLSARNHPKDEGMGTRTIRLTRTIYIDRSDFHMVDDPNYYGLAPGARPRQIACRPQPTLSGAHHACVAVAVARARARRQGGGAQVRWLLREVHRRHPRRGRPARRAARAHGPGQREPRQEAAAQGRAAVGARRGQGGTRRGAAVRPPLHGRERGRRAGLAGVLQQQLARGGAWRAGRAVRARGQARRPHAVRARGLLRVRPGQRATRPRVQSLRHAQGGEGQAGCVEGLAPAPLSIVLMRYHLYRTAILHRVTVGDSPTRASSSICRERRASH